MITKEQYEEANKQHEAAEKIMNQYHREKQLTFDQRLKSGVPFTDDDLMYSAYDLCPCGHGLAYPKDCGFGHYWDCSAILKGIADSKVKHTGQLPFAFYSIKSEIQPSANGSTTRGVFKPKE